MSFQYQTFVSLPANLNRQWNGPLDISSVFLTENDLKYYLSKGAHKEGVSEYWYKDETKYILPRPYNGQIIATVFDGSPVVKVINEIEDGVYEAVNLIDHSQLDETIGELNGKIAEIRGEIGTRGDGETDPTGIYEELHNIYGVIGSQGTENTDPTGIYKVIADGDATLLQQLEIVSKDYLTSQDKDELAGAIVTAKNDVIKQILTGEATETVNEAYDTLLEVSKWITTSGKEATDLITVVNTLKNETVKGISDSLNETKGKVDTNAGDIKTLQQDVKDLGDLIGDLPEGASSDTVIGYISESLTPYAKSTELQALSKELSDYKTANGTAIGELSDVIGGIESSLDGKVDKKFSTVEGEQVAWTLLSPENAKKLDALDFSNGELVVSGVVSANNVSNLDKWITDHRDTVPGLLSEEAYTLLDGALQGVQVYKKDGSLLSLSRDANGMVALQKATDTVSGTVVSTAVSRDANGVVTNPNTVEVKSDGTMSVAAVNANSLVQDEDEYIVLYGGSAKELIV